MCGAAINRGILCEKCDKPRKPKVAAKATEAPPPAEPPAPPTPPPPTPVGESTATRRSAGPAAAAATAPAQEPEPFPKAPLLAFPVESASPAITSVANVIMAAGAPAIVLGADRTVKFITEEAKKLFGVPQADLASVKQIEALSGARIGELSVPTSTALRIRNRNILFTLVPISGGAMGAVLMFREADTMNPSHASFVAFVKETVFTPLRSLRESVLASSRTRQRDPLLEDWAATIDQILSSLEMAPEVEEPAPAARTPRVVDLLHSVANRFGPFADLKSIHLQIDVPELEERFRNHEQLTDALGVLMDNGPVVPEPLRQAIFEPVFAWNPQAAERTGRSLFKVREFAAAHAGSVWVESKTGKACTFFLRVRPDGAR